MAQIRERLRKNGKKTFFVRIRMKGNPEATASFERLTDARIWAHGNGTFINPDGSTFEGTYNDGERDGKGTVITSDGCKYVGEFKDNQPNGQGTFTFVKGEWEGDKYVGEFKDGVPNGQGTYTTSSGGK